GGQGWDYAPRAVSRPARRRLEGGRRLRTGSHLRAASPPFRGEQPLPPDPRGRRPPPERPEPGRPARRDRRAEGPPVVRGEPVPSRVQVATRAAPPPVRWLRGGRARGPGGTRAGA